MNKRKVIKLVSLSIAFFVFLTFTLYLLRNYNPDALVFDQILYLSFFFLVIATFMGTRSFQSFVPRIQFLGIILVVSFFFYSFYSVMLVNIDRSRSFYVLSWVGKDKIHYVNGKIHVNVQSMEAINLEGVEQRINEQKDRGLIEISGDKIYLTWYGKGFLVISNLFADVFKLDNWEKNNH